MLGGAAVAEIDGNGNWSRGYVYAGNELLAVQQGGVYWAHEDAVTKSKRITDIYGNVVSMVELDPWGADTNRSSNAAFLPQNFTTYIRDANGGQDAMARRYSIGGRFSQPDPYGGSYDFSDPQSFNRYAYTKNDPINFLDPTGLMCQVFSFEGTIQWVCDLAGWDPLLFDPFGGYNGTGGKGGGTGGGTAGKEPQKPAPKPADNQQNEFNDCARKAWLRYRRTYLKTTGKAIGGGVGLGLGLGVMRGAPSGAGVGLSSVGFGLRGAVHALGDTAVPVFGRLLSAMYEANDSVIIGGAISFFSGKLAVDAVHEAGQNSDTLNQQLEECKKKFPSANHKFTFLL